jgi:hypothetical protein
LEIRRGGDNHPIELIDNNMIDQRINYTHNNPVEAGIVENDFEYIYIRRGGVQKVFVERLV